jgi:hypothetical protein
MSESSVKNRYAIDTRQLKTLIRTSLKTDLRGSSGLGQGLGGKSSGIAPLIGLLIMYLMMGLVTAAVMWKVNDLFWGSFVTSGMVMVFCGLLILMEFSNLILTPEDFPILSPHPVNSKTFFAAKLLHLVIYISAVVAAIALAASLVGAIRHGNLLFFPLIFFSAWGSGLATAMFFVIFYTLMLRFTSRDTMYRYLSYLQLVLLIFIYGGYAAYPGLLKALAELKSASLSLPWLHFLPPAWYASWVALFTQEISAQVIWGACVGVAFLAIASYAAVSRLSLSYAMTLTDLVAQSENKGKKRGDIGLVTRLIRAISSPEDRVVWRLIRTQFKYDNRYKIGILSIVPLTIFYLYLGMQDGQSLIDPFAVVSGSEIAQVNFLFYMTFAMIPYMLVLSTAYSSTYQAAWIYYASPADRTGLVLGSARFVVFFFCIPYLIFMCAIFSYFFGSVLHAILHSIVIYLLIQVLVNVMVLVMPRFPFSLPMQAGQRVGLMMLMFLIPMPVMLVPMMIISKLGYGGAIGYISITLGLILLNLLVSFWLRKTTPRRLAKFEFVETV